MAEARTRIENEGLGRIESEAKDRDRSLDHIDILLLIFYSFWLVVAIANTTLLGIYQADGTFYVLRAICLGAALVLALISTKYTARDVAVLIALAILLFAAYRSTISIVIDCLIWLYVLRYIPLRNLLKCSSCVLTACLVIVILLSQIGFISDYISIDGNERVRHYLGFRYPLYPAQLLFSVSLMVVILVKKEHILAWVAGLLFANFVLFMLTNARLSFYLITGFLLIAVFVKGRVGISQGSRWSKILCLSAFTLCAVLSVALTISYDPYNEFLVFINSSGLLGGRLSLGQNAIEQYGITLLGQRVDLIGNGLNFQGEWKREGVYNYVDSLYVQLLVRYGVVFTVAFIGGMTAAMKRAYDKKNYIVCLSLCFVAVHCMVDDLAIMLYFDPLLLVMAPLLRTTSIDEQKANRIAGFFGKSIKRCR